MSYIASKTDRSCPVPIGRLLCVMALVVVFLVVVYIGIHHMILTGFARIERDQAARDLARCSDAIRSEASHLDQLCGDWAVWDDTYQFMENRNAGYLQVNVDWPTLEKISGVNMLVFCQNDGAVIFAQAYEHVSGGAVDGTPLALDLLRRYRSLLEHASDESICVGIALSTRGPMLVSSRPILKSDGKGPSRGTIIMGRLLNNALLTDLKDQTKIPFTMTVLDNAKLSESDRQTLKRLDNNEFAFDALNRNVLTGLGSLSDVQGNPALMLRVEFPRDITKQALVTIHLAAWYAIATFLLLLSLLAFLLTLYLFKCKRRYRQLADADAASEAHALLETLLAQAPCGIVIAEAPDVTIRSANAAALAIRGGDPAQLINIGMPLHALRWQILKPDGTSYPPERLPLSRAVREGAPARDEELIIRDDADRDHRVIANAVPICDAHGRVTAGVLFLNDVTDRTPDNPLSLTSRITPP